MKVLTQSRLLESGTSTMRRLWMAETCTISLTDMEHDAIVSGLAVIKSYLKAGCACSKCVLLVMNPIRL